MVEVTLVVFTVLHFGETELSDDHQITAMGGGALNLCL